MTKMNMIVANQMYHTLARLGFVDHRHGEWPKLVEKWRDGEWRLK